MRALLVYLFVALISVFSIGCSKAEHAPDDGERSSSAVDTEAGKNENSEKAYQSITDQAEDTIDVFKLLKTETIDLALRVLEGKTNLREMVEAYGPIMQIDWTDGAFYRHEKIDLWVAYFSDQSLVVDMEYLDAKGPFPALDAEINAPNLRLMCNLSDLFLESDNLTVDCFTPFSEISHSALNASLIINFDYDGLTVTIISDNGDILSDCSIVYLSNLIRANSQSDAKSIRTDECTQRILGVYSPDDEKDGNTYIITLTENQYYYTLHLNDAELNLLQSFELNTIVYTGIEFLDVNLDGYVDIVVRTGGTLNETCSLFIWNSLSQTLVPVTYDGFDMVSYFEVYEGYLMSWVKESAFSGFVRTLRWFDDTLVLEAEESYELVDE